ncbi:WD40 repeat domain-containing protein [Saccharopolyspora erythraea]|uniref:WD40 repeat domain-containing protein n=1 Tax=Saccharopolyspora erythraea TaxID=1836 RepID=UPI001BADE00F|nr:WD40 repeat domain-containing protein [Saccharopolyspora erythraea]QUH02103.1 WD40 repeat domain-containing protein [Saccharopolyspora erythraea]
MSDHRISRTFPDSEGDAVHTLAPLVLDGTPAVIGTHGDGSLWTCDLTTGERLPRDIDLDDAAPEEPVPDAEGTIWDDEDEDFEDEKGKPDAYEVLHQLTATRLDGRPVLVTGGGRFDLTALLGEDYLGGAVRCWDLTTGEKIGKTVTGHGLGVTALTTVPSARGPLVLSSSEEGLLLVSALASGERIAEIRGSYNGVMTASVVDGRPVAVTGGHDPRVEVWDALTGEAVGGHRTTGTHVDAIAVTELAGRAVMLTAGDDNELRMWDLITGEPLGAPLSGHAGSIQAITLAGERPIAVTEAADEPPLVWDLTRSEQLGGALTAPDEHSPTAVTATEINGEPVAVTGHADGTIRIWNIATS